jgi:hypothetical protein
MPLERVRALRSHTDMSIGRLLAALGSTAALAVLVVGCGGHSRGVTYRLIPTMSCLRKAGHPVIRFGRLTFAEYRFRTAYIDTRVGGRLVEVFFHASPTGARMDFDSFKRLEPHGLAHLSGKARATAKRYLDSANYRVGSVFVAWALLAGKAVPIPDASRRALASCLQL